MRRIYNISILLGVLLIGLIACNKDKENTMTTNNESEVYWSEEDVKIQNTILDFQNKIQNNSFKDGEMMSVEDALWNLEALMNYTYSNPVNNNTELLNDNSLEIPVTIENGGISASQIESIVSQLDAHILAVYNQVPNEDKALIGVDVTLVENDLKDNGSNINMQVYVGYDLVDDPTHYPPFGEDDYWKYGRGWQNDGGYCDGPNAGTSLDSDAAEEIALRVNNPVIQGTDPYKDSYYVQFVTLSRNPDHYNNEEDDTPEDNMFDRLLFYSHDYPLTPGDDGRHSCLNPIEMNFYLQGALDIIDLELESIQMNNPTENWEFVELFLEGSEFLGSSPCDYLHFAEITYGQLGVKVPPTD